MGLTTDDLSVRFAGKPEPAVDRVSLDVPDGAFVVLVGPSGSGKSTLLHALAGLQRPSSGRVLHGEEHVRGPHPRRGMVFQRDVLFPWTTVHANIAYALRARGVPRREHADQVAELLDAVGLSAAVARRRPYELSGGMRQRVGIARMLAGEPDTMLMDEPFAALDAQTRLRMQDLVTDLWAKLRRTVVFVTHDVDEAVRLSDRIIVLADGRVRSVIDNDLPRPRPADRLADIAGYSALRRRLHEELHPPSTVPAPAGHVTT